MKFSGKTRGAAAALMWVLVAGAASAAVTDQDLKKARAAAHFVVSQQNPQGEFEGGFSPIGTTADAIVSLVAARRGNEAIEDGLDYLETRQAQVDNVGLKAKVIMALVAGGRNPRDFSGRNLVREVKGSQEPTGRYGAGTAVFDHALAMLALEAANLAPSRDAEWWLVKAQCADGGWEYLEPAGSQDQHCFNGGSDDFFLSDTNTSALAVQALRFGPRIPLQRSPFRFFGAARDEEKEGWGYSPRSLTDTNSTALVIQAYVSRGKDLPQGAKAALRRLQHPLCEENGAFAYTWAEEEGSGNYVRTSPDLGATVAAIPALLEKPFPIRRADVTKGAPAPNCG